MRYVVYLTLCSGEVRKGNVVTAGGREARLRLCDEGRVQSYRAKPLTKKYREEKACRISLTLEAVKPNV